MKKIMWLLCLMLIGCTQIINEEKEEMKEEIVFEDIVLSDTILLDVPYYNQHALHVPLGCEAICLYSALEYHQIQIDLDSFLNHLPSSEDDPHLGFVGSIYGPRIEGKLPAIYPDALKKYGDQFIECNDLSGANLFELKLALYKQMPVLVWVTTHFQEPVIKEYAFGKAIENTHTVLLVGYDEDGFIYHDPNIQGNLHISYEQFDSIYSVSKMALSV